MPTAERAAEREEGLQNTAGDAGSAVVLAGLMRRLAAARSRDEILAVVSHAIREQLQADGATFVLRDNDHCFYAEEDAISPLWTGKRFPLAACISGWCMLNRRSAAIADIYKDPRIPVDAYRPTFVRSLAMVPVGGEAPFAALGAYWASLHQPRPAELLRLQTIADAAAMALAGLEGPGRAAAGAGRDAPRRSVLAAAHRSADELVEEIRRIGLQPDTLWAYAFAVLCVAASTLVREVFRLSGVDGLAVFSTFYPAVLLAVLFGGRGAGIFAAVLGGLAAFYFFMPPLHGFETLTTTDLLNLALYGGASAMIVLIIDGRRRAIELLRREDALHLTLAREQHHRTRNAGALVESIVRQSLHDQPDRAAAINRRVRAGMDNFVDDETAPDEFQLRTLLGKELAAYDLTRFHLDGRDDALPPGARNIVALVAHELATNALKYGALSVDTGRVEVTWRRQGDRELIRWREVGGPPVQPPLRRGYGSVLLSRLIQTFGGALVIDFDAKGVTAELSLPVGPARRAQRAAAG